MLQPQKYLLKLSAGEIAEAANGKLALDILQEKTTKPINIVICDLNMPEMDGMEFLRHLGAARSDASVIIISSHDNTLLSAVEKMAQAYHVKLLGVLQKPIISGELEVFISQHKSASLGETARPVAAQNFTLGNILQGIKNKEFEPFYQPKIAFRTGLINGAEALARWLHPNYGVIAPSAFIEPLEKSDNIDELTFLVLDKAVAGCRAIHDMGYSISVAVNLSSKSLSDPGMAEKITQTVKNAGVETKYIILEVTESATATNVAQSLENLARLRMHGFGLSIDDYGTGFSNMQQMTRIAFSELKIDQTFVKGCSADKELCVVIKSSIEMAHKLKMECTAEGVETRQEWDALKDMNCDTAQGYFIAKPMNLVSFLEFCSTHSPKTLIAA